MNVARPALHCIRQNVIHQLDDRRFFSRLFHRRQIQRRFVFGLQLDTIPLPLINEADNFLNLFFTLDVVNTAVMFLDGIHDGRLGGHNRFNIEPGHELDVVHRKYVGGIHHGHRQRRSHAAERQDLILHRRFHGNQFGDARIHFKITQIDAGDAILP